MGNNLNSLKKQKLDEIQKKFHETCNQNLDFSQDDLAFAKLPAHKIRKMLFSSNYDIDLPTVFKIFHFAKQLNNNQYNSFADVFFIEPLIEAHRFQTSIDNDKSLTPESLPLLGFVFSIKEHLNIKGSDSTQGCFDNVGKTCLKNSTLFDFLKSKGALFSCKGNVPQALFSLESANNIFGYTKNSINPERISGGSSGGEAVHLATNVVNAGIGSDIGGSLRIPSLFCGICAFKPTAGRFDMSCSSGLFQNQEHEGTQGENQVILTPTIGPMARTVKDLRIIAKVMNDFNFTQKCLPKIDWKSPNCPKKVGVIKILEHGLDLPACCYRVLNEAKSAFEKKDIELIEIDINPFLEEIMINSFCAFFKDEELASWISGQGIIGEPLIESYETFIKIMKTPISMIKSLLRSDLISYREKIFYKAFIRSKESNSMLIRLAQVKIAKQIIALFKKVDVEVAITTGFFPAPFHAQTGDMFFGIMHTTIWNFLNFSAGSLPVSEVFEHEQYFDSKYNDKYDLEMEKLMIDSIGLPVGIQVVGLPWMDENVLETMEVLEKCLEN